MYELPYLDEHDRQILKALEQDGRRAYAQIAQDLGISNTMVHQRVARLKDLGVLKQVSIILDEKKLASNCWKCKSRRR